MATRLGLYFYNAKAPTSGGGADFRDSSCRPDPEFAVPSLAICRPSERRRIDSWYRAGDKVALLFYAKRPGADEYFTVGYGELQSCHPSHQAAARALSPPYPLNLLVPHNPCLEGGTIARSGRVHRGGDHCSCALYAERVNTPYLVFDPSTFRLQLTAPPCLSYSQMCLMIPRRAELYRTSSRFQQATSGWAHWLENPTDQALILAHVTNTLPVAPWPSAVLSDDTEPRACGAPKRC